MNPMAMLLTCSHSHDYANPSQTIADYYSFGINAVQKANGNMLFIIHDAFLPLSTWSTFNPVPNAVLDTHHYEGERIPVTLMIVFGTTFDLQGQLYSICGLGNNITVSQGSINTVVGEWSGAD
jgi:hypothetical protein